jgi:predicted ATPase
MHQWLSADTGNQKLNNHLIGIMAIQKLAIAQNFGWKRFIDMVDQVYPKKKHVLNEEDAII